jgi:hypothetical protein
VQADCAACAAGLERVGAMGGRFEHH